MVLPHHKSDFKGLPDEDAARNALKGVPTGTYTMPFFADRADMGKPEGKQKMEEGPVVMLTAMPNGLPAMGKSLAIWFVFCLFIGVVIAYVLTRSVGADAGFSKVFQLASTVAWMGYGAASVQRSVWFGEPWSTTVKHLLDALLYGLATGAIFALMW